MSKRTLYLGTMAKIRNWYTIQSMKLKFTPIAWSEAQSVRPFFFFLTVTFVGMYIWSVLAIPALRETQRLILFTGLLALHLALHWSIFLIYNRRHLQLIYFIIQGLLALSITVLSENIGMSFGLYMALIGEAVGALEKKKGWTAVAVSYFLALSLLSYKLLGIWQDVYWALLSLLPMTLFVVIYVSLFNRQSSAREQAQALAAELENANRQLSEYAARVEDLTITNERERLARDLHDTLSQGLVGLILKLEAVDAHLANARVEKAQAIISQTMTEARSTLADVRNAISNLRESNLEELEDALRLEISRFTNATGIPCNFHVDQTPPLADSVKETIVRAVAEGLTNIAHHAQARNVSVNVGMKDKNLLVTIQDDGQGFDADSIPTGHYGLLGIRERVRLIDGAFEIQSTKVNGTILKIQIPL